MSINPYDDSRAALQLRLSYAVDDARALTPEAVDKRFLFLCRTYMQQIDEALTERYSKNAD